jgi:hypothetical protein
VDPAPRPDARAAQIVAGWLFGMGYCLSLGVVGAPFLLYGVLRRPRRLLPTVKKVLIAAGGSLALCALVPFLVIALDL